MSTESRPESAQHLKNVFDLYEKIREFNELELTYDYSGLKNNFHCYVKEDIDSVLDRFAKIFSVPSGQLESVKEGMRSGIIDLTLLPQGEVASFSTPISSEELQSLLYVLSRIFFRSMKKSLNVDNIYWEEGKCPVCNSTPSISMIDDMW